MAPGIGVLIAIAVFFIRWLISSAEKDDLTFSDEFDAYAMNSRHLKTFKQLLQEQNYTLIEKEILKMPADRFSQLADYFGLILEEGDFDDWLIDTEYPDIPNLLLGVHYDFLGWQARSHNRASEVSHDQFLGFHEYQNMAIDQYNKIDNNSPFMAEVHSRSIRAYKSLGQTTTAKLHFQEAISINPNHLAAHLNYSEMIQPKWGGSHELIDDLLKTLPDNQLIKQVVKLKLTWDALLMEDNYFGGTAEELPQLASETIIKIDQECSAAPSQSIQRFIVYIYMYYIADHIKNKKLANKYYKKANGAFSIYSHGVT